MKSIDTNARGEALTIVNTTNTAIAAQSGSLPVFGTPFMIALMEKATCNAVRDYLEDGETTVGTKIDVEHTHASAISCVVKAFAQVEEVDGRRIVFKVTAKDDSSNIIGSGHIERFVVYSDRFMKRIEAK